MNNHNFKTKNDLIKYRSYRFSKDIVLFVSNFPSTRVYWVISDQLLRSATSIGANVIEAQAASSKRDFIKFFQIALKSANETNYWLTLVKDTMKPQDMVIIKLLTECDELSKMLGASLITMKGKRNGK